MSDGDDQARDVALATTGAGLAAVVQSVAEMRGLGPVLGPVAALLAGAVPGIIGVAFQKRAERRAAEAARGMAKVPFDPNSVPNNETTQEAFLSMFYDMIDAVDDAAAAPLGHIAMSYAKWGLSPDSFFRAFGRVVRELDKSELDDLVRLLEESIRRIDKHEATSSDAVICRTNFRDPWGRSIEFREPGEDKWTAAVSVGNGVRLLSLLKQHGLAFEPTSEPGSYGADPIRALVWRGVAGRALIHLKIDPTDYPRPG